MHHTSRRLLDQSPQFHCQLALFVRFQRVTTRHLVLLCVEESVIDYYKYGYSIVSGTPLHTYWQGFFVLENVCDLATARLEDGRLTGYFDCCGGWVSP